MVEHILGKVVFAFFENPEPDGVESDDSPTLKPSFILVLEPALTYRYTCQNDSYSIFPLGRNGGKRESISQNHIRRVESDDHSIVSLLAKKDGTILFVRICHTIAASVLSVAFTFTVTT